MMKIFICITFVIISFLTGYYLAESMNEPALIMVFGFISAFIVALMSVRN